MTGKQEKPKSKKNATYHTAAFAAFNYLLREYKHNGDVELFDNRYLSKQPLEIDIIVVKKNKNVEITESWGEIFREHNIIEYKSPVDKAVSLDVFNKVIHGYTGIYASNESIKLTQMTATIVCFRKPVRLFEQLKSELNYKISQKDNGIYYISAEGSVAEKSLGIQFIVSSELEDSVVVLKALRSKIDEETAKMVVKLPVDDDKTNVSLEPWWEVMSMINGEIIVEILKKEKDMNRKYKIARLMDENGFLEDIKREQMLRGMQQGMQQIIAFLKSQGQNTLEIEKRFCRV